MSLYRALIAAGVSLPLLWGAAAAQSDQNAADNGQGAAVGENAEDAQVQPPADQAVEPEAKKVAENEKVVCKFITTAGSRLGRKVCGTKKEWDEMRKEAQESVSDTQRRGAAYGTKQ